MEGAVLDCPRCGRELVSTGVPSCPLVCPRCQPRSLQVAMEVRARAGRAADERAGLFALLAWPACRTSGCERPAPPGNDGVCDLCHERERIARVRTGAEEARRLRRRVQPWWRRWLTRLGA